MYVLIAAFATFPRHPILVYSPQFSRSPSRRASSFSPAVFGVSYTIYHKTNPFVHYYYPHCTIYCHYHPPYPFRSELSTSKPSAGVSSPSLYMICSPCIPRCSCRRGPWRRRCRGHCGVFVCLGVTSAPACCGLLLEAAHPSPICTAAGRPEEDH